MWFALTPIIGDQRLKPELFWAFSHDAGMGRAMGRLDERFERTGQAYLAIGSAYRLDSFAHLHSGVPYTEESFLGIFTPQEQNEGRVVPEWESA